MASFMARACWSTQVLLPQLSPALALALTELEPYPHSNLAAAGGCGKYHATWSRGTVVTGRYVFADGLEYTVPADGDWSYCRPDGDRRFYSELVSGLR